MTHLFSSTFLPVSERRLLGFAIVKPTSAPAGPDKSPQGLAAKLEGLNATGLDTAEAKDLPIKLAGELKAMATADQANAEVKFKGAVSAAVLAEFGHELGEINKRTPAPAPVDAANEAAQKVMQDFNGMANIAIDATTGAPTINVSIDAPTSGPRQAPRNRGEELTQTMEDAQKEFEDAGKENPPNAMKQFAAAMKGLGAAVQYIKGAFDGSNDKGPQGGPNSGPNSGNNLPPGSGVHRGEVSQMMKDVQKSVPGVKTIAALRAHKQTRLNTVNDELNPVKPGVAQNVVNKKLEKGALEAARDSLPATAQERTELDGKITAKQAEIDAQEKVVEQFRTEKKQLEADLQKITEAETESTDEKTKLESSITSMKNLVNTPAVQGNAKGAEMESIVDSLKVVTGDDGMSMVLEIDGTAMGKSVADITTLLRSNGMDVSGIDQATGKMKDPKPLLDTIQKVVERMGDVNRELTDNGLKIDTVTSKLDAASIQKLQSMGNADLAKAYVEVGGSGVDASIKKEVRQAVEGRFSTGVNAGNKDLMITVLQKGPAGCSAQNANAIAELLAIAEIGKKAQITLKDDAMIDITMDKAAADKLLTDQKDAIEALGPAAGVVMNKLKAVGQW